MCKDGECLECMTIDRNQLSDYLDKIARFLIDGGSVKTDDMVQEEIPVYVVEAVTALRERVAKLENQLKDAQKVAVYFSKLGHGVRPSLGAMRLARAYEAALKSQ